MAFLDSLSSDYEDWRKALLRERDVLALGQEATLTFDKLVELAVVEQTQLLQDQTEKLIAAPVPPPPTQQAPKRNISQVDEPSQPHSHRPCRLPHYSSAKHTNQTCKTQNPTLRQQDRRDTKADQKYTANRPEIETPRLRDSSLNESELNSETGSDNGPQIRSERESGCDSQSDTQSDSEIDSGSDSEDADESRQGTSVEDQDDASTIDRDEIPEDHNHDDKPSERGSTADEAWEQFAAARYAEVQAQIDLVGRTLDNCKQGIKNSRRHVPLVGNLSGKWLLYGKEYVSGTADHYRIQLWKATTEEQRQSQPNNERYQGRLTIGPHGKSEPFMIPSLLPPRHVVGRSMLMHVRRPGGKTYRAEVTFWGNGKMIVTLPPAVLDVVGDNTPSFKFAGLQSDRSPGINTQPNKGSLNHSSNDRDGVSVHSRPAGRLKYNSRVEATIDDDRIIRTDRSTSVAVKIEQEDSDMLMDDDDQNSTAIAIKAEGSESSDSDDESADDAATIIDMVQRQKDSLRGGLLAPLQDLPGMGISTLQTTSKISVKASKSRSTIV
jgi:hypothetical protein